MLALLGGCLISAGAMPAQAAPAHFFGVQAWETPSQAEFMKMQAGGVGRFRFLMAWSTVEPTPGVRDWSQPDLVVQRATEAKLALLPYVSGSTPAWTGNSHNPPIRTLTARRAWTRFLRDAAARYGPGGAFWREHPGLTPQPIRTWQIWNEPNLRTYWFGRPSPREYVQLLKLSRRALRQIDPRARTVLAGLPETRERGLRTMAGFLRAIYRVPGAREAIDIVAIHPYATDYRGVLGAVRRVRRVMAAAGAGATSIWLTEIGWGTGGRKTARSRPFRVTRAMQAQRLRGLLRATLRERKRLGIGMLTWFSWRDRAPAEAEPDWWALHTGLFTRAGRAKPAWAAFVRVASSSRAR